MLNIGLILEMNDNVKIANELEKLKVEELKEEIMAKSDKDCYTKLCEGLDCYQCEEGDV